MLHTCSYEESIIIRRSKTSSQTCTKSEAYKVYKHSGRKEYKEKKNLMHRHYIFITWTIAHFQKHRSCYWLKICRIFNFCTVIMFPILYHITEPNPAPTLQSKIPANILDFFSIAEFTKQIQIIYVLCFILLKRKYRASISTEGRGGVKS